MRTPSCHSKQRNSALHSGTPTFGDLAGVTLLATKGHADIHVVGSGIRQVLCTTVHCPAAHRLRRLAS